MGLSNRFQSFFIFYLLDQFFIKSAFFTVLLNTLHLQNCFAFFRWLKKMYEYRTNFKRTKIRIDLYCIHCYFPIKLIFYAMIVTNKNEHFHMFMSANPKSAIILSHLWRINVNFRTYVDNHSAMYNIIAAIR